MYNTEIKYILKQPFDYSSDGKTAQAQEILLKAPTNLVAVNCCVIESQIRKAQKQGADEITKTLADDPEKLRQLVDMREELVKADEQAKESATGKEIVQELVSCGLDLNKCMTAFKGILIDGDCAYVDSLVKLQPVTYNRINYNDTLEMLGEFIKSFFSL